MQAQMDDLGEFFRLASAGAQRHAARRKAIDHVAPDGAEITGTLDHEKLAHLVGIVQRRTQPQPGETGLRCISRDIVEIAQVEGKQVRREFVRYDSGLRDSVDGHGCLEE